MVRVGAAAVASLLLRSHASSWRRTMKSYRGALRCHLPRLPPSCAFHAVPLPAAAASAVSPASPPSKRRTFVVSPSDASLRLDRWLRTQLPVHAGPHLQRIDQLCRNKFIRLRQHTSEHTATPNARLCAAYRVQAGDRIEVVAWIVDGGAGTGAAGAPIADSEPPRARVSLSSTAVAELRRRVLYEDAQLLVLNKPAGLACHAGSKHSERHLDAMLWALEGDATTDAAHSSAVGPSLSTSLSSSSLRLVHRLDKETSGCLLLAKGRHAADVLATLLRQPAATHSVDTHTPHLHALLESVASPDGTSTLSPGLPVYSPAVWSDTPPAGALVQKRYLALVHGRPRQQEGVLLSAADTGGLCHSSYRVLAVSDTASAAGSPQQPVVSLLELQAHTGRKRQLRQHCHLQLGCTLVGEQLRMLDVVERSNAPAAQARAHTDHALSTLLGWDTQATSKRTLPLCLHAHQVMLRHPALHNGQLLRVQAPLPAPFAKLCRALFGWTQAKSV